PDVRSVETRKQRQTSASYQRLWPQGCRAVSGFGERLRPIQRRKRRRPFPVRETETCRENTPPHKPAGPSGHPNIPTTQSKDQEHGLAGFCAARIAGLASVLCIRHNSDKRLRALHRVEFREDTSSGTHCIARPKDDPDAGKPPVGRLPRKPGSDDESSDLAANSGFGLPKR